MTDDGKAKGEPTSKAEPAAAVKPVLKKYTVKTTYYVDAQTGERYRSRQIMSWAVSNSTTLVRTDNLRVSERAKEFVTTEYRRKKKK